jgi:hypothetical protein
VNKYPPDGPSKRTIRLLLALPVLLIVANLADQAGVW